MRRGRLVALGSGLLVFLAPAWVQPSAPPARPAGHEAEQRHALEAQIQWLEDYRERQRIGLLALSAIAGSLPDLLWLDRLTISPQEVRIEGRAFNTNAIANFIEKLDTVPDFEDPTLRSATEEPDGVYAFTLSMPPGRRPAPGTEPLPELKAQRDGLLRLLTPDRRMPAVSQQIQKLFDEPGFTEVRFGPEYSARRERLVGVKPIYVHVQAASYYDLAGLFVRVDQFPRILTLRRMVVTAKSSDSTARPLSVDLELSLPVLNAKESTGDPSAPRSEVPAVAPAREPFQLLALDETARSQLKPAGVPDLLIEDLSLMAIFRTSKGYVAQVNAVSRKRHYLLKEGDHLKNGEVVRVTPSELVFRPISGQPGAPEPSPELILKLLSQPQG